MKPEIKEVMQSIFQHATEQAENEIERNKLIQTAHELGIKIESK